MSLPIISHGSENSLDHDVYIIVPEKLSNQESKNICHKYKKFNANLITVEDGVVSWVYKGTIDECNNSIISTFNLHSQTIVNPIKKALPRDYSLKMLRTIRGILSHCSRTQYRQQVKKSLKSNNIIDKISTLKLINLNEITDFDKNNIIEVYKFLAFQLGQTLALLIDNQELFTKNTVAEKYPDLSIFLKREKGDVSILQKYLCLFTETVENNVTLIKHHPLLFKTEFFNIKEIVDTKQEVKLRPVVVFDLDNTLYDESHRAKYRVSNELDTYFSLCRMDKPILNIVNILLDYYNSGYEIWIVSGRYEPLSMEDTLFSLKRDNIPFHYIKLRGENNFVPDYVLKPAWMSKYIGLERIEAVYDDQERVIEGFRKKGLLVFDAKDYH